jgi:type IV secretion system protein VirB1
MLTVGTLVMMCGFPHDRELMSRIIRTESGGRIYAVAEVNGSGHFPTSISQALATIDSAHAAGRKVSVGIAQIYEDNVKRFGVELAQAFEPCVNLQMAHQILLECRARSHAQDERVVLRQVLSCYNSGNFITGQSNGYVSATLGD